MKISNNGCELRPLRPCSAEDNLCSALAERECFLASHPHLLSYQAEIDRLLDKSGHQSGRLSVLAMLMQGKLQEMQRECSRLSQILKHTRETFGAERR